MTMHTTGQGQSVLVLETGEDEHLNPLTRWGYFFPSVRSTGFGMERIVSTIVYVPGPKYSSTPRDQSSDPTNTLKCPT